MRRPSFVYLFLALVFTSLTLIACTGAPAVSGTSSPGAAQPTSTLPATASPTQATLPTSTAMRVPTGAGNTPGITISPTTGNVKTSAVRVTVTGQGFPAGPVSLLIGPRPGNVAIPGGPSTVGSAQAGADGSFQTTISVPEDVPLLADTRDLTVLAVSADGTKGANADFTNSGGQDLSNALVFDYTSPALGFRFQIPAGWRARQSYNVADSVGLYDAAERAPTGSEPVLVRMVADQGEIDGKPIAQLSLQEYASKAYATQYKGRADLKLGSVSEILSPSGRKAYQALWHISGQSDLLIFYLDYDRSVNGKYYRAAQVYYDTASNSPGAFNSVVSTLAVVPLGPPAAAEAAGATVEKFMFDVIQQDNAAAQTLLSPALRSHVALNNPSISLLLGIQNLPSKFTVTDAAAYTIGKEQRAVVKGYMSFDQPSPVQFELSWQGTNGPWLIDEVIPLQ